MENIKISTSRDFRINTATVQAILEQNEETENESEEENADNDEVEVNSMITWLIFITSQKLMLECFCREEQHLGSNFQ